MQTLYNLMLYCYLDIMSLNLQITNKAAFSICDGGTPRARVHGRVDGKHETLSQLIWGR